MATDIALETAQRDVEESERQIALHRALIAQLRSARQPTTIPQKLLRQLEQTLAERRSRLKALNEAARDDVQL